MWRNLLFLTCLSFVRPTDYILYGVSYLIKKTYKSDIVYVSLVLLTRSFNDGEKIHFFVLICLHCFCSLFFCLGTKKIAVRLNKDVHIKQYKITFTKLTTTIY